MQKWLHSNFVKQKTKNNITGQVKKISYFGLRF
jgi:hypothetical protein